MQVIIDDYGAFLGKKGERFVVHHKEKPADEFPAESVEQILIIAASSVSTEAVKMAAERDIDIVYLSRIGKPFARVYPCRLGGTTLTRKCQLEAYFTETAAEIAKKLVEAKIKNQAYLLRSLGKSRKSGDFKDASDAILGYAKGIGRLEGNVDNIRNQLLGIEGSSASAYFSALSKILPFKGRDSEGTDPVNVSLNYGYGILYAETERACVIAGLDPYLGFMHTDRYNKPSMVLDLIEGFRPIMADRAIITLFVQKQMKEADFEKEGGQVFISKEGRSKIINAVMERLHTKIKSGDETVALQDMMLSQARAVAKAVLSKDASAFQPFVYKW